MPFSAQVIRILVASPADTVEERERVATTIYRWNADHAEASGKVLLPVRWEENATAETGDDPQAIINRQLVDSCDVLVGLFWTRLGTPTSSGAVSGTAEEIQQFIDAGKPAGLYFSTRSVSPAAIDLEQLAALNEFKAQQRQAGLHTEFSGLDELERAVTSMLVRVVRDRFNVPAESAGVATAAVAQQTAALQAARGLIRASVEREPSRTSRSDNFYLRLDNVGEAEAQQVSVVTAPVGGSEAAWELLRDGAVEYMAPGGSARYPLLLHLGSPASTNCTVTWLNPDGSEASARQTLTL